MFKNLSRGACALFAAIVASAGAAAAPAAAPPASAAAGAKTPLIVGFVYVTPVGEAGWTYQHELGRREMARALGARVRTIAVE
jgi:basic membrane protein A and related proteins